MPLNNRIVRLYLDQDLTGENLALDEPESRYLGTVLRLKVGDAIRVFNGRGQERDAVIHAMARRQIELALHASVAPLPESALKLTLIQALPKTDAMDLIVQKATELGVHALIPVSTEFSVPRIKTERAARRMEHWMRIARSACEQSGRHRPIEIRPATSLEDCLQSLPAQSTRIILDTTAHERIPAALPESSEIFLLIGPEGGFSASDRSCISKSSFLTFRFGPRILRAETAAITACGLLQYLWGDLSAAKGHE